MALTYKIEELQEIWEHGDFELFILGQLEIAKKHPEEKDNEVIFSYNGNVLKTTTFSRALPMLVPFPVLFNLGFEITADVFLEIDSTFSGKTIPKYIAMLVESLQFHKTEVHEILLEDLGNMLTLFAHIGCQLSAIYSATMDLNSIIKVNVENDGILNKYWNYSIPKDKTYKDIEKERETLFKELEAILTTHKNCLTTYLRSKTGINVKQLAQSIFSVGYKPDLNGKVIEYPIDSNFFVGLTNAKQYFVNAKGARKALIINHREVKAAGYSTRKLSLLCIDSNLFIDENDPEFTEDCGSKNFLLYTIENDKEFTRFIGRVARFEGTTDEDWFVLEEADFETVKDKPLEVRSPITCQTHANGKGICKTCFGDALYELNRKYNVGLIAVNFLTSELTQNLLSTKHFSSVNTLDHDWSEVNKYFEVHTNTIIAKENILDCSIQFDIDEDSGEFDTLILINKNESILAELKFPVPLISLIPFSDMLIDNGTYTIESNKINFNTELFTYSADNREMSKSLKLVQGLIERKSRDGIENAHQLTKALITALNDSGISLNAVYLEIIIFNLMKNVGKDFINEQHELNDIMGISEAIQSKSTSIAISFERFKDLLKNPNFYNNKRKSVYDTFYK